MNWKWKRFQIGNEKNELKIKLISNWKWKLNLKIFEVQLACLRQANWTSKIFKLNFHFQFEINFIFNSFFSFPIWKRFHFQFISLVFSNETHIIVILRKYNSNIFIFLYFGVSQMFQNWSKKQQVKREPPYPPKVPPSHDPITHNIAELKLNQASLI